MGVLLLDEKSEVKILVDYLCFTVKLDDLKSRDLGGCGNDLERLRDLIECEMLLGFGQVDFDCKRAFYGYAESYCRQGITYCVGGRDDVYIQMSGSGCRYWETLNKEVEWLDYIKGLREKFRSLHFSRLDIAGDSFNLLQIAKIQTATIKQQYVSKWRKYLVCAGNAENSVLFGSPKSDFRLRIYDKTCERREAGCNDVPGQWVRAEFQMRDDAALSFLDSWVSLGNLGSTYSGIMMNQLRYWASYDGVHTERMKLKSWWRAFLGNVERIPMAYKGGLEYNLEKLERFVYKQAGSSIKTLLKVHQGDISRFLDNVESAKLNDAQKALLASAEHIEL